MMFKSIKDVSFPCLEVLFLRNNNIESIEGLNRIYMPHLKTLIICKPTNIKAENRINTVTDLKKANWQYPSF